MITTKKPGQFITFEGLDGCGKTTQLDNLANRLEDKGIPFAKTRAIGGTKMGEEIRALFKKGPDITGITEALLMSACCHESLNCFMRAALAEGCWVLCDRWYDSCYAYQGFGRGVLLERLKALKNIAVDDFQPNLTFYFHCPLPILRTRMEGNDRFERLGDDFFERVASGFDTLSFHEPHRIRRLDGTQPVLDIAAQVWAAISSKI